MSGLMRAIALPSLLLLAACNKPSSPPPSSTPQSPTSSPAAGQAPTGAGATEKTAAAPSATAQPSVSAPGAGKPSTGATATAKLAPDGAAGAAGASTGTSAAAGSMQRTPSGLSYAVLREGQGTSPAEGSKVKLHFTGWLPSGKVFIDTRASNIPKEFTLSKADLISGWVEALLSMKKGEKRKLHVPSNLGYGTMGYTGVVPPRSDLDFELELLDFSAPAAR